MAKCVRCTGMTLLAVVNQCLHRKAKPVDQPFRCLQPHYGVLEACNQLYLLQAADGYTFVADVVDGEKVLPPCTEGHGIGVQMTSSSKRQLQRLDTQRQRFINIYKHTSTAFGCFGSSCCSLLLQENLLKTQSARPKPRTSLPNIKK